MPVQPQFARQQIDTRGQFKPHNRIRGYGEDPRFSPDDAIPLPEPRQQQPQTPSSGTSVPDLSTLLSAASAAGSGFQGPSFQLPGISGLSAGGGTQVGPSGVSVSAPDQSAMYNSYMNAVTGLGTGQQDLVGSIIGNILGLTGQLGTANIGADAQRDVSTIQADSARDVATINTASGENIANIQAQLQRDLEESRRAGLIDDREYDVRLANIQTASQQRIAEIQAQASVRPAELQYQTFSEGLESIRPFMQALLGQFGGGIAGSTDSNQIDPNALVNAAQAANAQAVASQQRAGAPSGGSPATEAASRAGAQQLAALNARDAFQIPFDVNQQNFQNRQTSQNTNNAILGNLLRVITG